MKVILTWFEVCADIVFLIGPESYLLFWLFWRAGLDYDSKSLGGITTKVAYYSLGWMDADARAAKGKSCTQARGNNLSVPLSFSLQVVDSLHLTTMRSAFIAAYLVFWQLSRVITFGKVNIFYCIILVKSSKICLPCAVDLNWKFVWYSIGFNVLMKLESNSLNEVGMLIAQVGSSNAPLFDTQLSRMLLNQNKVIFAIFLESSRFFA